MKDCVVKATTATSTGSMRIRPLCIQARSSGSLKFENCEFGNTPYTGQIYVNALSGSATLEFLKCNFNNKTPNIMFGATHPLTSLTMTDNTKLTSVTLETQRAKTAITDADLTYIRAMIAGNSFSSVRLFYTGNQSEYIR